MKKFIAASLALALVVPTLLPVHAFADDAAAAEEPITLTVFRGDPGDQPTEDNKIYQKIKDEFGVSFEFEFLAGDLDEKLGMMIAGEDYPDLFDGASGPTSSRRRHVSSIRMTTAMTSFTSSRTTALPTASRSSTRSTARRSSCRSRFLSGQAILRFTPSMSTST